MPPSILPLPSRYNSTSTSPSRPSTAPAQPGLALLLPRGWAGRQAGCFRRCAAPPAPAARTPAGGFASPFWAARMLLLPAASAAPARPPAQPLSATRGAAAGDGSELAWPLATAPAPPPRGAGMRQPRYSTPAAAAPASRPPASGSRSAGHCRPSRRAGAMSRMLACHPKPWCCQLQQPARAPLWLVQCQRQAACPPAFSRHRSAVSRRFVS